MNSLPHLLGSVQATAAAMEEETLCYVLLVTANPPADDISITIIDPLQFSHDDRGSGGITDRQLFVTAVVRTVEYSSIVSLIGLCP